MKLKKLVRQLEEYLDASSRERKEHREEMKSLLQKMKAKEKRLAAKALVEFDEAKLQQLKKDIDLLHAQRKKGISALQKLLGKHETID